MFYSATLKLTYVACLDIGTNVAIHELVPDYTTDRASQKVIPCAEGVVCLPQYPSEMIEWRSRQPTSSSSSTSPSSLRFSADLRVVVDGKVAQVVEGAYVRCGAFADAGCLVTGGSDYTVRFWKVWRAGQGSGPSEAVSGVSSLLAQGTGMRVTLSNIMRVHMDEVVCITASRAWSMVVSGSKDGSAAIWDLNRGVYVRSIWHCDEKKGSNETAVNLVSINESTVCDFGLFSLCDFNAFAGIYCDLFETQVDATHYQRSIDCSVGFDIHTFVFYTCADDHVARLP